VVWNVATTTLHVESDELLDEHTRYALVVTRGVRDMVGDPVGPAQTFQRFRHDLNFGQTKDSTLKAYRKELLDALAAVATLGVNPREVVVASVFTTQSSTVVLEKIRDQIQAGTPGAADFLLGPHGGRTVFSLADLTNLTLTRQTSTVPAFSTELIPLPGVLGALTHAPTAVGTLAFGRFQAPDYEITPDRYIPPVGTRSGVPVVQGTNEIFFNLLLPSGSPLPGGWPVAIYGHGGGGNKEEALAIAAMLAAHDVATIGINAVGHGRGPLGTVTVARTAGDPITFPAGGRGIDQNGDGLIGSREGRSAAPPRTAISRRDGMVQTAADLMRLVQVIETGIDVDGDGIADLDASRIYYVGVSFGGQYGTAFLAVERQVCCGVLNVAGGPTIDQDRLADPVGLGAFLAQRVPPLDNLGGGAFEANTPFRDQLPVVNTVAGAMEIQELLDRLEWVGQSGNPVAYACHLRRVPLAGVPPKSVIVQLARGDRTTPNPTTTNMLRAGNLADRATHLRWDLFNAARIAGDPAIPPVFKRLLRDPHPFLVGGGPLFQPPPFWPAELGALTLDAQEQVATFFASNGTVMLDPDGPGALFETPIVPPLPEEPFFIP
jgi:hypothetical protein